MKRSYRHQAALWALSLALLFAPASISAAEISADTESCIGCHSMVTPGIVSDWQASRHFKIPPSEALKKEKISRRISTEKIPENWLKRLSAAPSVI